jgi:hypothetical protein
VVIPKSLCNTKLPRASFGLSAGAGGILSKGIT